MTLVKRSLQGHEDIIASGLKSFIDVGISLMAIRDERLYEAQYDTFESYCKVRWGFAKSRAYQLISSAVVVDELSTIVDTETKKSGGKCNIPLPVNEAQARAVADATDDPSKQKQVWRAAVESAPKAQDGTPKITAAIVKKAAAAVVGKHKASEATRQPGEDAPERRHTQSAASVNRNGKTTIAAKPYDAEAVTKQFGALARAIDDMAGSCGLNNQSAHKQAIGHLSKALDGFRALVKECDAVQARKAKA